MDQIVRHGLSEAIFYAALVELARGSYQAVVQGRNDEPVQNAAHLGRSAPRPELLKTTPLPA